jgi:hypothetical protein
MRLYFPAHLDEDVINSYSKTKGKLWNQSRIDIEKRAAVPYLLRELARRNAVAGGDITDILKMPKKMTREVHSATGTATRICNLATTRYHNK